MMIDELSSIERYAALSDNFARAVRYLKETDLETLPLGTVRVDGENVYILVQQNQTRPQPPRYEAHDRYADIQLVLEGRERFGYGWNAPLGPLEEGKDVRFGNVEKEIQFVLEKGQFALFLPGEAHAPCLAAEGVSEQCRKLVIKVLCG